MKLTDQLTIFGAYIVASAIAAFILVKYEFTLAGSPDIILAPFSTFVVLFFLWKQIASSIEHRKKLWLVFYSLLLVILSFSLFLFLTTLSVSIIEVGIFAENLSDYFILLLFGLILSGWVTLPITFITSISLYLFHNRDSVNN